MTKLGGIRRHGLAIESVGTVVILMIVVIAIFARYPTASLLLPLSLDYKRHGNMAHDQVEL